MSGDELRQVGRTLALATRVGCAGELGFGTGKMLHGFHCVKTEPVTSALLQVGRALPSASRVGGAREISSGLG